MAWQPRGVIVDFDGVVTRTLPRDKLLRRTEKELNLAAGDLMQVLFSGDHWWALSTGKVSTQEYWDHITHLLGPNIPPVLEPFRDNPFAYEELNLTTVKWLGSLRRLHKIALLSNATLYLDQLLEESELRRLFDVVVNSARVGWRKPDPEIYELTLSRMGLVREDCVFIDDKERNISAARAIGLPAIHFPSAAAARRQFAAMVAQSPAPYAGLGSQRTPSRTSL